jgi:hypothetical protein
MVYEPTDARRHSLAQIGDQFSLHNFGNCSQFFFGCPLMFFFALGTVMAALVASLTVTSRGGKEKNAAAVPVQAVKNSPKKKNLGNVRIKQEDMNPSSSKKKIGYHFKIMKLKPDIEVIWIDATPGNDGYGQDLFNHITNENGFREFGLLAVARRRINQATNEELKNDRNDYTRRCIVRSLDGPSTHESRLAILYAFQAYQSRPEFNRYQSIYTVGSDSDLTPDDPAHLVAVDHFILDDIIVNFMCKVYEDTDASWYSKNTESALDFFTGPLFPTYAVDTLGYPSSGANNPGFAAGFNLPNANES